MLCIPLPVRVLINSLDYMIDTFMVAIYLSECSTYTLFLLFVGSRLFSNRLISKSPLAIAGFVLFIDILVVGRHIFKDYTDYGIITDFFGKGKDTLWHILNFDICIFIFQILKFFTVYNYTTLAIANHIPSTVAKVIEDYGQPDYNLQYISVLSNDDDDYEKNLEQKNKNESDIDENNDEDEDEDAIKPISSSKHNKSKKHHLHKYEPRGGIFGKLFRKNGHIIDDDISENDESALLIENGKDRLNSDDLYSNEEEEDDDDDENLEKHKYNNNGNGNNNNNKPLSNINNNQYNTINNPTTNTIPDDILINYNNQESNKKESFEIEATTSNTLSQIKSKDKGKSPSSSPYLTSVTPNTINSNHHKNKGKEKANDDENIENKNKNNNKNNNNNNNSDNEEDDDVFFDAFENNLLSPDSPSSNPSPIPSIHSNSIPLQRRHPSINSVSYETLPNIPSSSTSSLNNNNNNNDNNNQNSAPEIDERLRTTEGNENALLYLESYYQYLPIINIKFKEAVHLILAIRNSNRRARERELQRQRQEQQQNQQESPESPESEQTDTNTSTTNETTNQNSIQNRIQNSIRRSLTAISNTA